MKTFSVLCGVSFFLVFSTKDDANETWKARVIATCFICRNYIVLKFRTTLLSHYQELNGSPVTILNMQKLQITWEKEIYWCINLPVFRPPGTGMGAGAAKKGKGKGKKRERSSAAVQREKTLTRWMPCDGYIRHQNDHLSGRMTDTSVMVSDKLRAWEGLGHC